MWMHFGIKDLIDVLSNSDCSTIERIIQKKVLYVDALWYKRSD